MEPCVECLSRPPGPKVSEQLGARGSGVESYERTQFSRAGSRLSKDGNAMGQLLEDLAPGLMQTAVVLVGSEPGRCLQQPAAL